MKTYHGHPGDPPTITVTDGGGPRILKAKNEEIGFAWGSPYEGAGPGQLANATEEESIAVRQKFRNRAAAINQSILAIMTDLLGNEDEAITVYQRMKHRTVLIWPSNQPWRVTESTLMAFVDEIKKIERETTATIRRSSYAREVVNEGGGGVVWDTDIEGRRRGPR